MSEERKDMTCSIVKDLLPLYIDGLTSVETGSYINKHLRTCESCRKAYEAMKDDIVQDAVNAKKSDTKEIDYLKKTRKKHRTALILAAAAAVLLTLLSDFVFTRYLSHERGKNASVTITEVDGRTIKYNASLFGTDETIAKVKTETKDGSMILKFYAREQEDGKNTFTGKVTLPSGVDTIYLTDGRPVYDDGTILSLEASELYAAKTKEIADASQIENILDLISPDLIGSYVTALGGESITVTVPEEVEASSASRSFYEGYADLLMACVEDCNTVIFKTPEKSHYFYAADAQSRYRVSVKNFGSSPKKLMALYENARAKAAAEESSLITVTIINSTDQAYDSVGAYCRINGNKDDESAAFLSEIDMKSSVNSILSFSLDYKAEADDTITLIALLGEETYEIAYDYHPGDSAMLVIAEDGTIGMAE